MSLSKLIKAFNLEIVDCNMEINRPTEHHVLCKFQPVVIVPISAISNNASFVCCKGEKTIYTADKVTCSCIHWEELHFLDMDEEVQKIYHCSSWDFGQKWHKYDKSMVSMSFIKMELVKKEIKNE